MKTFAHSAILAAGFAAANASPKSFDDPLFVSPTDADGLAPHSTVFFGLGVFRSSSEGSRNGAAFKAQRQDLGFSSGALVRSENSPLEFRYGLGVSALFGTSRLNAEGLVSNARAVESEVRALGIGSLVATESVHLGAGFEFMRASIAEGSASKASVSGARPVFGLGLRLAALTIDFSALFPLEKKKQGQETDGGEASTARLDEPMHLAAKGTWRTSEGFTSGLLLTHTALESKGGGRRPTEAEKWAVGAFAEIAFADGLSLRPLVTSRRLAPAGSPLQVWGGSLQGEALTPIGAFTPELGFSYGKGASAKVSEALCRVSWRALL
jgi:hypothetical protein